MGMRVTGHCASALPLVAAGMDGKEHLGPAGCSNGPGGVWGEDLVQLFEASGIAVTPTLEVRRNAYFPGMLDDADVAASVSPALRWFVQQLPPARVAGTDFGAPTIRHLAAQRLRGTDVLIGTGQDGFVPGSLHWELEGMNQSNEGKVRDYRRLVCVFFTTCPNYHFLSNLSMNSLEAETAAGLASLERLN